MYESETSIPSGSVKKAKASRSRSQGQPVKNEVKKRLSLELRPATIDSNLGLPSIKPHADEPYGMWYTIKKSIRGFWATRETEDTVTNKELYVRTTMRELFVYIMFLITTLIMTFGSINSTAFYLTSALTNVFVGTEDGSKFTELNNYENLLTFLKGPMLDGIYWDEWYNHKSVKDYGGSNDLIYYTNKMLGLPRIRQLRVKNGSCHIPAEFHDIIFDCYSDYSIGQEDTEPFGLKVGLPWTYQTASDTGMAAYWGKLATYSGGGYIQDLTNLKNVSTSLIESLQANRWLDQATRAVLIDLTVYNANLNLFATVRLCAEMPPTGSLVTSVNIRVIKLIKYLTNADYAVLAFECIFCFFVLYYIGEEFIEISKLKFRYFHSFWNILDITVLICATTCIGCSISHFMLVNETLEALLAVSNKYVDFEYLSFYQVTLNNSMAVTVFCAWIKVFKYLSFNKTMMQLSSTLGRAAHDVGSFAVMFFIVFFAFAQLGFFLFGTQLKEYSDVGTASFTLMRIILGDFDFDSLQGANRLFGPIFFFLYIFFVFFVLLNMFLAIINETYSAVKEDLSHKQNDFEMTDFIKKGFKRFIRAFHIKRFQRKKKSKDIDDRIMKHKVLLELGRWEDDLKSRGYSRAEITEVFGAMPPEGQGDAGAHAKDQADHHVAGLEARVKKLEASLSSILAHFDQTLAKLDVMERAKLNRAKKFDAIIDNLDGGKFHKSEKKEDLVAQDALESSTRTPSTRKRSTKKKAA